MEKEELQKLDLKKAKKIISKIELMISSAKTITIEDMDEEDRKYQNEKNMK